MTIVGFAGFQGTGKSTMASFCEAAFGFKQLSFADPLKRIVQDLYGFSDQQMYGPSQYRNEPDLRYLRDDGTYLTPREALERFGTEAGRFCYKNTWCNKAIELARTYSCTVFADARFLNEFEAIKAAGGFVVRLVRPDIACGGHLSETEQGALPDSYFDLVIDTSGEKRESQYQLLLWWHSFVTPRMQAA